MTMHRLGFYPFAIPQAFPIVAAQATYNSSTSVSTIPMPLPASIAAGDLLVVTIQNTNSPAEKPAKMPDGWVGFPFTRFSNSIYMQSWYKRADGTEGSTVNITITQAGPNRAWSGLSQRITGAHPTIAPELIAVSTGTSSVSTIDAPNNAPSWGSAKTLWMILSGVTNNGRTASAWPTGYSLYRQSISNGNDGSMISASRELEAASEDPGVLTFTGGTTTTIGHLLAVPPAGLTDGYPYVTASRPTTTGSTTSHVVDMPTGITSGELLLWHVVGGGTQTLNPPTGWTALQASHNNGGGNMSAIFYRFATGSETSTYTMTTSSATRMAHHVFRVAGAHASTPPEKGTIVVVATTAVDPPSLTPSWGSAKNLWQVFFHSVGSDVPLSMSLELTGNGGAPVGDDFSNNPNRTLSVMGRRLEAMSYDPTSFTGPHSINISQTIAIRPA